MRKEDYHSLIASQFSLPLDESGATQPKRGQLNLCLVLFDLLNPTVDFNLPNLVIKIFCITFTLNMGRSNLTSNLKKGFLDASLGFLELWW